MHGVMTNTKLVSQLFLQTSSRPTNRSIMWTEHVVLQPDDDDYDDSRLHAKSVICLYSQY